MIGLDNSGKTTLLKQMKTFETNSFDYFMSTPYLSLEKIKLPSSTTKECLAYDLSGHGRYRESWSFFYTDVDGIFFVVDCADLERLSIVKEVLYDIARNPAF